MCFFYIMVLGFGHMGWTIKYIYIWGVNLVCPGVDGVNMCKPCPNSWVSPCQTYPSPTAEFVIPRLFGVNSWVFLPPWLQIFFMEYCSEKIIRNVNDKQRLSISYPSCRFFQASYRDYHSLLWNIMPREHIYDVPIQHGDCPWFSIL